MSGVLAMRSVIARPAICSEGWPAGQRGSRGAVVQQRARGLFVDELKAQAMLGELGERRQNFGGGDRRVEQTEEGGAALRLAGYAYAGAEDRQKEQPAWPPLLILHQHYWAGQREPAGVHGPLGPFAAHPLGPDIQSDGRPIALHRLNMGDHEQIGRFTAGLHREVGSAVGPLARLVLG
jgi:hypothetical protein